MDKENKNFYKNLKQLLDDKYIVNYFFRLNIIVEFYKKYSDENCNHRRSGNWKNFNNQ